MRMNQCLSSENLPAAADQSFLAALDASPALMWLSDATFSGLYFNRTWRDFTGRSLEQELDGGWMTNVHPDDIERIEACAAALTARQSFRVEYRLRRHDGAWRWMLDSGRPHFDPDDEFLMYVGSCIDITDRKEAEDARIRSEERLKLAQEAAAVGTYDWHVGDDELCWSPEMFRLYGIDPKTPPAELYDAWLERLHPEDRERADAETKAFVNSAASLVIEFRIIHPEKGERWIHGRGQMRRDAEDRPLRMIGVNFDITEQRLTEQNLRESQQRITDIAENFPGVIFRRITYPDGRVEYPYLSGAKDTLFNVPRGRFAGIQTLEELSKHIHYDDIEEMLARLKKSTEDMTALEIEGRIIGENGDVAWVRSISRPRPRADGALIWDGVILDVTEQHRRQAERERAATMLRMTMEVAGLGTWEYDPGAETVSGSGITNAAFGLPEDGTARPLADYMEALHPDDRAWVEHGIIEGGKNREDVSREYRVIGDGGGVRWVNSVGTHVRLSDGTERVIGAMSDITARKRQEEDREAHLRHQRDLLRELNHRVKNNLQLVLSLMRIEASRGPEMDGLRRAIAKVETIGDLHSRLSFLSGAGQIDFRAYLEDLAGKLRDLLSDGNRIVVSCSAKTCVLELDRAVPLGLALHELTTHAIARGDAAGNPGTISLELECGPAGAEAVTVTDDRASDGQASGLNARLVRGMCHQIGATFEQLDGPDVGYRITFRRDPGRP